MEDSSRPLAIVTGASTGIGFELAKLAATDGHDLVIAADDERVNVAASSLRTIGVSVEPCLVDLATHGDVDRVLSTVGQRPVAALVVNASRGLGRGFLDQRWPDVERVIDANVKGTLYLVQRVAQGMRRRRSGRVLIVGSIVSLMPGTFQAVHNGTKALLDSFSFALRGELAGSGVTVTCLMPGMTETDFFERAERETNGTTKRKKQAPEEIARIGWEAMQCGDGDVMAGWQTKLRAAMTHLVPTTVLGDRGASGTAAKP
jgi:short-subunit dehydrogenase